MTWWWLSNGKITVAVGVDDTKTIRVTPPIVRTFVGQPIGNLSRWLQNSGDLVYEKLA